MCIRNFLFWARTILLVLAALVVGSCGGGSQDVSSASATRNGSRAAVKALVFSNVGFTGNGWYWDPNASGTGMAVEAQGDSGFVGLFMYDDAGKPVWYVSTGTFSNGDSGKVQFTGDLRKFFGGQTLGGAWKAPSSVSVGTLNIAFTGSGKATKALVSLPGGRSWSTERFNFNGLDTLNPDTQPETGWFWNPAESGRGYAIEVQNNQIFMAMFHYAADGSPTWNIVQDTISADGRVTSSKLWKYSNGQTLAGNYKAPSNPVADGVTNLDFGAPCAGRISFNNWAAIAIQRFKFSTLDDSEICQTTSMVSTVAGVTRGTNGAAAEAQFSYPTRMIREGDNLYVAESIGSIRKIALSTGIVSTLAGDLPCYSSTEGFGSAACLNYPSGLASDGSNLYVAGGDHTIRKIVLATGAVSILAGQAGESGSTDGTGAAARFNEPEGLASDGKNLYVADSSNHMIRKIVLATGAVSTLAGQPGYSWVAGTIDGRGSAARFAHPAGLVINGNYLYVVDSASYEIRRVTLATGDVITIAGSITCRSNKDGVGLAACFDKPADITSDGSNLYVADTYNQTIRKVVLATGAVSTMAGQKYGGIGKLSQDGTGTSARFNYPEGITTDGTSIFVADTGNSTIRKIEIASLRVTTLAGIPPGRDGAARQANFENPIGITSDGSHLYVLDRTNQTIRKISLNTGAVSTFAGQVGVYGSQDGVGANASFTDPEGITSDGVNLYVTDSSNQTIRKIVLATGLTTTLAGTTYMSGAQDGASATFRDSQGITTDGTSLYVADTGNHTIRKISLATGITTTLAGQAGMKGQVDGIGKAARFDTPMGITTDGTCLYVTTPTSIRKIVIATGAVSTLAGRYLEKGSADGIGSAARFNEPWGITTDGTYLYVADTMNFTIRKIELATGSVSTLAGKAATPGYADGSASQSRFFGSAGIIASGGALYVTEAGSNLIRKIKL